MVGSAILCSLAFLPAAAMYFPFTVAGSFALVERERASNFSKVRHLDIRPWPNIQMTDKRRKSTAANYQFSAIDYTLRLKKVEYCSPNASLGQ
jgi:hypothetical protein